MAEFTGKVAIVTGAGSGIGRMTALLFAREGAKVAVSDINEVSGDETVRLIQQAKGDAFFVKTDVSNHLACENLVKKTVEKFGHLDMACNNAGIGGEESRTADYSIEGWQKVIDIMLSGVFYCTKYEIPEMLKAGGGSIVNIASIMGQVGLITAPAYCAAKHGVVGFTQSAALEYAKEGIRINSVGPGWIKTPLTAPRMQSIEELNRIAALHPMGRLGKPEEIAEMVIWLSSDRASFVTGAYYPVDGGYLAQ
jgi:NAD(P)-dependent dehydrogenase (short-subunit alcohol dehydrogenase family)